MFDAPNQKNMPIENNSSDNTIIPPAETMIDNSISSSEPTLVTKDLHENYVTPDIPPVLNTSNNIDEPTIMQGELPGDNVLPVPNEGDMNNNLSVKDKINYFNNLNKTKGGKRKLKKRKTIKKRKQKTQKKQK
jgi:hypothetical protein